MNNYMLFSDETVEINVLCILMKYPDTSRIFLPLLKEEFFTGRRRIMFLCFQDLYSSLCNFENEDALINDWFARKGYNYLEFADIIEDINNRKVAWKNADAYFSNLESRHRANEAVRKIKKLLYPHGNKIIRNLDPFDFLKGLGEITTDALITGFRGQTEHTAITCESIIKEVDSPPVTPNGLIGVPTGFQKIDDVTQGFRQGHISIIAARPGVGKTILTLQFAHGAYQNGDLPLIISLEMTRNALIDRVVSQLTKIPINRVEKRQFNNDIERNEVKNVLSLISNGWEINDHPGFEIKEIVSNIGIELMRRKYGIIFIDHIQLIRLDKPIPRHLQISEILNYLTELSKKYKIPVVIACQLNRTLDKKANQRPQMGDLKESGSLEESAGLVIYLHRPGMFDRSQNPSYTEILIPKNRYGMPIGFRTQFDGGCMSFLQNLEAHKS